MASHLASGGGETRQQSGGWFGDIGLAQQNRIGERNLTNGLGMAIERGPSVQRIGNCSDSTERVVLRQIAIGHQGVQDRSWVGKARGLDDHAVIRIAALAQIEQGGDQVAADRAAEATGGEGEQGFVAAGDQFVI